MKYVYMGNVPGCDLNNTICPNCGKILIIRGFFDIEKYEITPEKTCPVCGENIPIIGEYAGSKKVLNEDED